MRKKLLLSLVCILVFSFQSMCAAGDHPSKEDVEKFVHGGADFAKKNGVKALLEEIQKGEKGQFMHGELYLSAYDFDVKVLAHAAKPHLAGKDFSKLKDKNGLNIGAAYLEAIKKGTGWIEYYWQNPVDQKVQKKLAYGVKVDDTCWICSGTYVDE